MDTYHLVQMCRVRLSSLLISLIALCALPASGASINFTFTIDEPAYTSAGVFKTDGTLVNTIWRKVRYSPGTYNGSWGGTNDDGTAAPAGTYQVRVLQNTMRYVWDGVIANSSAEKVGRTAHEGFYTINGMAAAGDKVFYCSGYNEGDYLFHGFKTNDPQHTVLNFSRRLQNSFLQNLSGTIADESWSWTASDGTWIYFACAGATTSANAPGFVIAYNVTDSSQAYFTSGQQISHGNDGTYWPNAISVGVQASVSGLAVQATGSILAVSVASENKVYLFDKRSGNLLRTITVTAPKGLAMAPNNDLWVITGTSVVRYTNLGSAPTAVATISGLSQPLAVAVHPSNNDIVMIADGGTSQQVKAYNSAAASQWTYGLAGGQPANGPVVANNVFWFFTRPHNQGNFTYLTIQADGSFWVGDPGNSRALHFTAGRTFIDQVMFMEHSYACAVDLNNPSRVFNEFLEFSVDYSKPLNATNGSWTLVRNWGASLAADPNRYFIERIGLKTVSTLNGHTYGLFHDYGNSEKRPLVELPSGNSPMRFTGIVWEKDSPSLESDNTLRRASGGTFYEQTFTGIDGSANPQWSGESVKATAPTGATDPVPGYMDFGPMRFPLTSGEVLVSFNSTLQNRMHLGGVKPGTSAWFWKASPSVTQNVPLDGLGSYDIGDFITYPANVAMASGHNIVYGFHGEFYANQGQACQHMHFYDDGLFVGQFGEETASHAPTRAAEGLLAGSAGNAFSPQLISTNGDVYLWHNDETGRGVHRWHLLGANTIRELNGNASLGGSVTLSGPAPAFPTALTAVGGNAAVNLTWNAAVGASSYNVKYSQTDGGPYLFAGNVGQTSALVAGLDNDALYYFVVTAVSGGGESAPSAQVQMRPFDPSVPVHFAGQIDDGRQGQKFNVSSTAPAAGKPALSLKYWLHNFVLSDVGTKGYALFNWAGNGIDRINVLSPFTVTKGTGWTVDDWLQQHFVLDGAEGSTLGLYSNPTGTININVTDSAFHYLTVFCPARFNDSRKYTVKLTPQGQSSPVASASIDNGAWVGSSSMFQFCFKGNVTLTVDSSGGAWGIINGLFLDDGGTLPAPPATPTGLQATPSSGQVALTWNVSSGATGYNVKRSTDNGATYVTIANVITTSYTDTTAVNNTTYKYVVSARNLGGESANSASVTATPTGIPAPPSSLSATPGDTLVTLNWSASSGAGTYSVKRSTVSGGPYTIIASNLTSISYTNTGLVNGTTYYYVVSAVNLYGESANSSQVSAIPTAGAGSSLSRNRPVTVSSTDTTFVGANAVDGNTGTRWSSIAGVDPQWIYVDLGAIYTIDRVVLNWDTAFALVYKLQVSLDAVNWTDIYSVANGAGGIEDLPVVGTGRYVRMYGIGRGTAGGYSLREFDVYGQAAVNLALNRPVNNSSYDTTYHPTNAVDGNLATRWSSAMGVDPQWIYVDLGSTYRVSRVKLVWQNSYATAYKIQVSDDLATWTDLYSTTTGTGGTNDLLLSGSGRFVRMYGTARATQYGYSLFEFEVYGKAITLISQFQPVNNSSYDTVYHPTNAVDGNLNSRWSSAQGVDPQWIYVDLGAVHKVRRVKLNWEAAYATDYLIQVSNDLSTWKDLYRTVTGDGGIDDLPLAGTGRFVRMYGNVRATPYGYSLWEFQVFE